MSRLIKGVHHVSLRCVGVLEFEKAKQFYGSLLGMESVREWTKPAHPSPLFLRG